MKTVSLPASYYQQFDADLSADVPAENFGGWKQGEIDLSTKHTALVVMHAWDCGSPNEWPGWHRAVEYHPRAANIAEEIFPELFESARSASIPIFHVVGDGDYYTAMDGYRKTLEIVGPSPTYSQITPDESYLRLAAFREKYVFVGEHNREDVDAGQAQMTFMPVARPKDGEHIAKDGHQVSSLCHHYGINHLIYTGFAINWCLLMSPGGMVDMNRYGILCSTIREAVTAVENAETAREEREKQQALWRVSVNFGFVFELKDFIAALKSIPSKSHK